MTFSFAAKAAVLLLFVGSTLYVHLRGKARLPVLRQFVNHSALFAPYNALMYLFSAVPSKPYLDRNKFPELDVLRDNWQVIREEAMHLFDEGYIRAAEKNNDAGFGSFFKKGWKRFYLKWYDKPLPSAETLCPKTVALVSSIPNVKGAMFALLPGGSHLNPHRDPFAGSLRYHLGLSTPNSDDCRIFVDGQVYAWRDGEDVMFVRDVCAQGQERNRADPGYPVLRRRAAIEQPPDDLDQPLGQCLPRACHRATERR